ncbi:MAG: hypothetical protein IKU82_02715 [Clostridia bacterium]|nr:hypothetical protein [Clostridia bacterium]
MKKAKKIIALTLCLLMCVFACPVVSAAVTPKIILSNESALPENEVTVDISITGNPGIMAMTFSVVYDKDQFEYVSYSKGFISTPQCKDHSDKGYVSFSVCETSNKSNNGNILSITFKIKKDAKPGKHTITIGNHNYEKAGKKIDNCFANSSEEYVVPTVKAGSIYVEGECDLVGHDYGEWKTTTEPSCQSTGLKTRVCAVCGIAEENILPISHDFEDDWTVDKAATPEENGIMSRHCKNCDEVTDTITFTYEEVGGDEDDTSSEESSSDDKGDNTSSEDTSSDDVSSDDIQVDSSDDSTTSSDASSSDSSSKKPPINNTVGSKNPLSAVEGLKDYQENIKPNIQEPAPEENTEDETTSSDVTTGVIDTDEDNKDDEGKSFFKTAIGVVVAVLAGLLSVGILALGAWFIITKNKKAKH